MNFANEKMSHEELMHQLSSIQVGTRIFDVYTYSSPAAKKRWERVRFGSLSTTSKCVQSLFGDRKLFFRHQRMEEDFAMKPEWIDDATSDACQASKKPISNWQCVSPAVVQTQLLLTSNLTTVV